MRIVLRLDIGLLCADNATPKKTVASVADESGVEDCVILAGMISGNNVTRKDNLNVDGQKIHFNMDSGRNETF